MEDEEKVGWMEQSLSGWWWVGRPRRDIGRVTRADVWSSSRSRQLSGRLRQAVNDVPGGVQQVCVAVGTQVKVVVVGRLHFLKLKRKTARCMGRVEAFRWRAVPCNGPRLSFHPWEKSPAAC